MRWADHLAGVLVKKCRAKGSFAIPGYKLLYHMKFDEEEISCKYVN